MDLLIEAVVGDRDDEVMAHVRGGVDVDSIDRRGRSALHAAIDNGNVGLVRALLDAGADPNLVVGGWTPLEHAIDSEIDFATNHDAEPADPTLTRLLLERGADPSIHGSLAEGSPLEQAQRRGHFLAAQLLRKARG